MLFRLPEQLQTELLAYDPTLKALARSQQQKKQAKKATHPLGNPNDLIPDDIIRSSVLQDAINNINGNPAAARFQIFTKIVDVATPEARTVTIAILYHYEQCWYAAWLPPKGKEDEYLYGYAYAHKDTATAMKMIPRPVKEDFELNHSIRKQYGRSTFHMRHDTVTVEQVRTSQYDSQVKRWNIPGVASYYKKSGDMYQAIKGFEEALRNKLPFWTDSRGIFDRVRSTSISKLLVEEVPDDTLGDPKTWQPSYESLIKLMDATVDDIYSYRLSEYKSLNTIRHIIETPYFRRWIQQHCDEAIKRFNDPATKTMAEVKRPWITIKTYLSAIRGVHSLWPDCPIDYYQNNINALIGVSFRLNHNERTFEWLREHMPVASFFHMLNKYYEEQEAEIAQNQNSYRRNWSFNERLGRNVHSFSDLTDALSMLTQVLSQGELEPPKRWRIAEFHDYVQGEAWKIKNPNEGLPQDLFPQPVKVELNGESWSFFQPYDTHQLSSWGQAVRNCVGSATHYAEDCKKKKHFIVLCMLNGKPQFTIQLTVDMGMMSVKQIAGIANQSLTQEQKDQYTKAFGLALQSRNNQLNS